MYEMMPPQPTQFVPPPEKKRLSVPQIMLIVAALGFLAWYLVTSLTPEPEHFAQITADTIGSRYTGDCLIVRDESPFDAEGVTSVNYVAEEGAMVYSGTIICTAFSSGFSTREMTTLQDYRDQIKEYQAKLLGAEITADTRLEGLERDVMTRAREVREIVRGARGNMNNQEKLLKAAIQSRQSYLREKYAKDQRMSRLYDDEQNQLQRISSWTKTYAAQGPGLVSFYSDGFEYVLNTENFDRFTPQEVRSMINGNRPEVSVLQKGKTTLYRLVRDSGWYVLMIIRESNWNPVEGEAYELRLENFRDTTVSATVAGFTRTGGELLVRLRVDSSVVPVLYIRSCTGVLGDSVSSLTVPLRALYYQDNMPGVVLVDGDYEWFIPVNVIEKRDGMYYIAAIQQGVLYEGQTVRLFN